VHSQNTYIFDYPYCNKLKINCLYIYILNEHFYIFSLFLIQLCCAQCFMGLLSFPSLKFSTPSLFHIHLWLYFWLIFNFIFFFASVWMVLWFTSAGWFGSWLKMLRLFWNPYGRSECGKKLPEPTLLTKLLFHSIDVEVKEHTYTETLFVEKE